MKKGTKLALIGVSCCLLASLVKCCAPEYDKTGAAVTNNQAPAYTQNYREENEKANEIWEGFSYEQQEESKGLSK
jgi:hypothetical protein